MYTESNYLVRVRGGKARTVEGNPAGNNLKPAQQGRGEALSARKE